MTRRDVRETLRLGRRQTSRFLVIYAKHNQESIKGCLACVVSKKVSKLAVVRHYYQRRMREIARSLEKQLVSHVNLVLVARPAITQIESWRDLKVEIKQPLERFLVEGKRRQK